MTRPLRTALAMLILAVGAVSACVSQTFPQGPATMSAILTADHLVMADGARLPLRVWLPQTPPRAVIVALHGMNDYSNFFDDPGQVLAGRGIVSYAYDQRGFGQAPHAGFWSGAQTMADDARTAVALIAQRHPGLPLYLLGESMGGAVAMVAATQDMPPVTGLILSAPGVWGRAGMGWGKRAALWVSSTLAPGWRLTGRGLGIVPSDNVEMLRKLGADPLVIKETRTDAIRGVVDLMDLAQAQAGAVALPALVLYGAHDEIIPEAPVRQVVAAMPQARMAYYATGYHMLLRDLRADLVLGDIAHWVLGQGGPLPSGAQQSQGHQGQSQKNR